MHRHAPEAFRSVKAVCVTADDFGLRAENDKVIVDLAMAGRLDAVSVAVHEDATLERVTELRGHVATGLHLVLVGERPLRPDALRPLLDPDGRLPRAWPALLAALVRRPDLTEAIGVELRAQLDRFDALGLPLGFVNGHQHTHLFPPVWRVLRAELAARGISPAVRLATGSHPKELAMVAAQTIAFAASGSPEGAPPLVAYGLAWSGHADKAGVDGTMSTIAAHPPARGLAEIVLHPGGDARGAAPRHAQWHYRWIEEAALIASGTIDAAARRYGLVRARPA